ncbi:MAG: DUF1801 domain-containing protein [Acidimicrobiia bacterium]|nr:DUF1801 domain-containing protein [Acidimicrobiia bacterium]
MGMSASAGSPDEYIGTLTGWSRDCAVYLRKHVKAAVAVEEEIKWGHLVYFSNGPAFLIRAEEKRVLFGFWRGQRLREIEPGLKPGGKYEMATLEIRSEPYPPPRVVKALAKAAVALNEELGNPQDAARK